MAFCARCGAQLADGSLFCANCGAPLQQQQAPNQQYQQAPNQQYRQAPNQQYQQAPNQQYQQAPNQQYRQAPNQQYQQAPNQQYRQAPYQQPTNQPSAFENFFNTPDYTAQMHPNDIAQNKAMGVLAYLGLLVLIPIFAAPQSKFARFHANQGLILDIAAIVLSVLVGVLTSFLPPLGILLALLDLPVIALLILGIVNAASGKAKELPLVGKIRILN